MRSFLSGFMVGAFMVGCATNPHTAPSASELGKSQGVKIYFQGEGSDREVKRFQKFLDIALDDYGMARVDSAANADEIVKLQFKTQKGTAHLYTPLVWITLASRNDEEYLFKSCNNVSTDTTVFTEPIKYLDPVKIPANWKKTHPHFAVYIDESGFKSFEELVKLLEKKLVEKNYTVVRNRAEADAVLKSIKIQKLAIPMQTIDHTRSFRIVDQRSGSEYMSGNGGEMTYIGAEKSVKVENLPCGPMIQDFGHHTSDRSWDDASRIADTIQEHVGKAAHSN